MQWATHERTGSWMIFDMELKPCGHNELRWVVEKGVARRSDENELGVLDHHATCPKVEEWRNHS